VSTAVPLVSLSRSPIDDLRSQLHAHKAAGGEVVAISVLELDTLLRRVGGLEQVAAMAAPIVAKFGVPETVQMLFARGPVFVAGSMSASVPPTLIKQCRDLFARECPELLAQGDTSAKTF
jgi:hypothetical protein